jgi:hypothetical protein
MIDRIEEASPLLKARIAGALYLLIIVGGGFAEIFVRQALTVHGDAAATAHNIAAFESLYRLGFAADLFNLIFGIAMALLFYDLFRAVSSSLAMLAMFFTLISTAINAALNILALLPLLLLSGGEYLKVFATNQLAAMALFSLELHAQGFAISLTFFAVQCVLTGYLIFRSTFLPRFLGVLYALAGLCYLINSFAIFLSPALEARIFPAILLPCFVGEASVCLWLLVAGVNVSRFEALSRAVAEVPRLRSSG